MMTVSEIQEWVSLHGFQTKVDGDFGPATLRCVQDFQRSKGLEVTKVRGIDGLTESTLRYPLDDCTSYPKKLDVPNPLAKVRELVVDYASHHLGWRPREVGGENRGPWVRLYMGGRQGREWPWCAGFATYILRAACISARIQMPVPYAFGCDYLAGIAQSRNKLTDNASLVQPGHLFLVRKAPNHWQHIGIVKSVDFASDVMQTIEGNTNDDGVPEGYEVCMRYRSLKGRDFIVF